MLVFALRECVQGELLLGGIRGRVYVIVMVRGGAPTRVRARVNVATLCVGMC